MDSSISKTGWPGRGPAADVAHYSGRSQRQCVVSRGVKAWRPVKEGHILPMQRSRPHCDQRPRRDYARFETYRRKTRNDLAPVFGGPLTSDAEDVLETGAFLRLESSNRSDGLCRGPFL